MYLLAFSLMNKVLRKLTEFPVWRSYTKSDKRYVSG